VCRVPRGGRHRRPLSTTPIRASRRADRAPLLPARRSNPHENARGPARIRSTDWAVAVAPAPALDGEWRVGRWREFPPSSRAPHNSIPLDAHLATYNSTRSEGKARADRSTTQLTRSSCSNHRPPARGAGLTARAEDRRRDSDRGTRRSGHELARTRPRHATKRDNRYRAHPGRDEFTPDPTYVAAARVTAAATTRAVDPPDTPVARRMDSTTGDGTSPGQPSQGSGSARAAERQPGVFLGRNPSGPTCTILPIERRPQAMGGPSPSDGSRMSCHSR